MQGAKQFGSRSVYRAAGPTSQGKTSSSLVARPSEHKRAPNGALFSVPGRSSRTRLRRMDLDLPRFDALEQHMWREVWDAAPAELAKAHGVELRRFGPLQVTAIADLPRQGWLNLVLGATFPGAIEEGRLEEAIGWVDSLAVDYYVPVTPGLAGSEPAERWLESRGHERGYAWMK